MRIGPSYEEVKKYEEEKEQIKVANEIKLAETIKSLKKATCKFNLKKCGVFVCYTLPTVLYFAVAIGGASSFSKLTGTKTYEHTTSYYSSSEDSSNISPEVYYSTSKEDESPKLILKGPWFKSPDGDKYDRPVYTYDLSAINIDDAQEWIKTINLDNIQAMMDSLPTPSKSFEDSYDEPSDNPSDYEIFVSVDNVNINKKVSDVDPRVFVIVCLVMAFIYVKRQIELREDFNEDRCFPNSLITALENLANSNDLKNICELEAEIESIKLSLSK